MAMGYRLGHIFLEPATQRERHLKLLGLVSSALVHRLNDYGRN
jgi:hypothetical protein